MIKIKEAKREKWEASSRRIQKKGNEAQKKQTLYIKGICSKESEGVPDMFLEKSVVERYWIQEG